MTVIHANVFDPSGTRLFKAKATDRAECQTITCENLSCPLLARKQCWMRGGLFGNSCPYGKSRREQGPTKRAASCWTWVRERKEKYKDVPFLDYPSSKVEFVGDYVLLPYAHMNMCKEVPFLSHGSILSQGSSFIPREHWTLKTVMALLSHRPQALMGGEITSYQKEEKPKFLLHLRETDPDMWAQLIEACPQFDVQANHIGRKAILATLNAPIVWTERSKEGSGYPVTWKWDGETLETESMNVFSKTWGKVDVASVVVKAKPAARASVVIQSNDWVNARTEFLT